MTDAELAILSLIVQEPRHGYQVEQTIKERGMRDWAEIAFSSIYYLLAKLERKGWIIGETDTADSNGPARKVYRVTQKGLSVWRRGVLEVLSTPRRYCTPLQVGLANLSTLPRDEAVAALTEYRRQLTERESHVRANLERVRAEGRLPWHAELMFDLSLAMTQAELSWVSELVRKLVAKPKGDGHV